VPKDTAGFTSQHPARKAIDLERRVVKEAVRGADPKTSFRINPRCGQKSGANEEGESSECCRASENVGILRGYDTGRASNWSMFTRADGGDSGEFKRYILKSGPLIKQIYNRDDAHDEQND